VFLFNLFFAHFGFWLINPVKLRFIKVPVSRQHNERSYVCVRGIDFASLGDIYLEFWKCSDSVVFFSNLLPLLIQNNTNDRVSFLHCDIILETDIISLSKHHSRDRHHKFVYVELNYIKYLLTYFQELQ
jgi:hypothetical protein